MSAVASVISPFSFSSAVELGNRLWSKKVLPVGDIEYQGRTLHFTPAYIRGLAEAFNRRAYDQVSFQLADSQNTHTNDPERHRGTIVDMKAQADGLYVTLQPTERGEAILRENPYLGVSARIVEQYQRSDGTFFPAAIQHILGTLDPRIPNLGQWEPVDMSNGGGSAIVIDLSNYQFTGQAAPLTAADIDDLSDTELADLLDVLDETGMLDGYDDDDELSHDELESLMAEIDAEDGDTPEPDPFTEFANVFSDHAAIELARAEAAAEPVARREEDRVAQLLRHAAQGVYSGQRPADFTAAESAAGEIMLANGGFGPCGPPDEYGRCSARFHALECGHGQAVDFAASGPHPETHEAALSNLADRMQLDLTPRPVWGDPASGDPGHVIPEATIELATALSHDWGLGSGGPGLPVEPAWRDLMGPPSGPVSTEDAMYKAMGYEPAAAEQPGYPGISELRARMGI